MVDPSLPETDIEYQFSSMTEVAELCSESRVWGGMHYPKAIEVSVGLVDGFGQAAYEWTKNLRNGEVLPAMLDEDKPVPAEPTICGHAGSLKKGKVLGEKQVADGCACKEFCAGVEGAKAWTSKVNADDQDLCKCHGGNFQIKTEKEKKKGKLKKRGSVTYVSML